MNNTLLTQWQALCWILPSSSFIVTKYNIFSYLFWLNAWPLTHSSPSPPFLSLFPSLLSVLSLPLQSPSSIILYNRIRQESLWERDAEEKVFENKKRMEVRQRKIKKENNDSPTSSPTSSSSSIKINTHNFNGTSYWLTRSFLIRFYFLFFIIIFIFFICLNISFWFNYNIFCLLDI